MAISFDKRKTQLICERLISDEQSKLPANSKYKFETLCLSSEQEAELKSNIIYDGIGFYYNALVSFFQGLLSLRNNSVSWACIELYYSTYYSLRALLASNDYTIIRYNGLYLLKILENQYPSKKNSREYNTDHKGTINYYVDHFRDSDYLCSNEIDGKIFYEWMMDLRETTNYRNIHFNEPDQFDILEEYVIKIAKDKESIKDILDCFEADWDYFCFSEESAWIAGPYKKLKETAEKFQQKGNSLEDEQKDYITKLMDLLGLSNLKNTFVI
ncbi:MAG: hypothetical protein IKB70_05915 [Bacilli bacterium]|nr:hypothetical protein [Bacilli bacterium]MBR3919737.1 hypothetical protein [Clostridia bacterium]